MLRSKKIAFLETSRGPLLTGGAGLQHSPKKRKNSVEGSLDRVRFAAELEFPKIPVPGLPTSESIKCNH